MSFCTLTLTFSHLLGSDLVPYASKRNILAYRSLPVSFKEIELCTTLNYFAGVVKTCKKLMCSFHSYIPYATLLFLLENSLSSSSHEGKSCVGMPNEQVCVKVLCITATA